MTPDHSDAWCFPRANPVPRDGKTLIMGIVNVTPDSFSGRNAAATPKEAAELAARLLADGADIVDIGAESSRPGAAVIGAEEEMRRLGDVVERVRGETDKPVSVDTYHPETARRVLEQGADIINDITALRGGWDEKSARSGDMARLVADYGAHAVLVHMPAPPVEMQREPEYHDVVAEVREFLLDRVEAAERAGVGRHALWLDPGFGFGKTFRHNRELLLHVSTLAEAGFPVVAGLSRKRMIADALGLPVEERFEASLALAVIASFLGADVVRVHDVKASARAVAMTDAVLDETWE